MTTPKNTNSKPVSASCCHMLAFACVAIGAWLIFELVKAPSRSTFEDSYMIGACFVGAVVWWALGDIVSSLYRIAQRRAPSE